MVSISSYTMVLIVYALQLFHSKITLQFKFKGHNLLSVYKDESKTVVQNIYHVFMGF